ncbi:MAG: hypothetical protein H0W74_05350 [Sphingosinicella sp.]|nr:hypothetical protein [Sphingosinicella sp.]
MRSLFKKAMTGSMIAGAALLVAACGGDNAEVNNTTTDLNAMDPMMEGTTNDVTAIDAGTGMDSNMATDANMTMDANTATTNTGMTDANMTNGM